MADVCAIPGHVGLGLNQAFLFGLPVVTLEGSQPPEIGYLRHGENGFIDGEGDVETLRRRIFHLLEDDEARRDSRTRPPGPSRRRRPSRTCLLDSGSAFSP